jgi:hypothetical protein
MSDRKFRVSIKETITYSVEFDEEELAELLPGVDVTMLAGDIEDEWLTAVDASDQQTPLEEFVRMDSTADIGIAEYHLEEV